MSLAKEFPLINECLRLRFEVDTFNIFNQPDFDKPKNNAFYFPGYSSPPYPPGQQQGGIGKLQHTIGSPRFMTLGLHLLF